MRLTTLSKLALLAGTAAASTALAQPAATDLGTLSLGTNLSLPASWAATSVTWYKFTIPALAAPQYLDIRTILPAAASDTEIGLYLQSPGSPAVSTFIVTDDDDGTGNLSELSWGATCPTRASSGATGGNGRDGATLAAGTYYLAVGSFNCDFTIAPTAFGVTTTGGASSATLQLVYGDVSTVAPSITSTSVTTSPVVPGGTVTISATLPSCLTAAAGVSVSVNLSALGLGNVQLFDDATNGDAVANNGVFTNNAIIIPGGAAPGGYYNLPVTATSAAGSGSAAVNIVVTGTGVANNVKISKVDGNGGVTTLCPTFDYVELYNPDAAPASMVGYSLQVATTTGATWANGVLPANLVIPPKSSALIRVGAVSATGISPTAAPDFAFITTSANLGTGGKVALVNSTTTLSAVANPAAPAGAVFVDKVGYGAASAGWAETANAAVLTTTPAVSLVRKCVGAVDFGNNSTDFVLAGYTAALPRNVASGPAIAAPTVSGVTVSTGSGVSPYASSVTASAVACSGVVSSVTINLSSVGGSAVQPMLDDGINDDLIAGNGIYGTGPITVTNAVQGTYSCTVSATDNGGNVGTGVASFTVFVPPTTVFNFGDMSVQNCQTQVFDLAAGQVKWFLFNSGASGISAGLGNFLDIDTHGSLGCPDTEIGVYTSTGALFNNDDDSGAGAESLLTFGAGTRPALVADGSCTGSSIAYDGLDGNLASGTYYIAVGMFNTTFNATGWSVTSTGPAATGVHLNLCSIPPNTPPTGVMSSPAIPELATATLSVTVTPGANPPSTGITVTADATTLGGGPGLVLDDAGNGTLGDNIYSATVATTVAAGTYAVPFVVADAQSRSSNGSFNATVIAVPGACCATDSSCSLLGAFACAASGGTYGGAGSNCGGATYAFQLNGGGAFEDIAATGTDISATPGDDGSFNVALSFPFTFYGTVFNTVNVCTNGFMSFTDTATAFGNASIPAAIAPNNLLAVLWDDYNFNQNTTDSLKTETRGTAGTDLRQIFQWTNVAQYSTAALNIDLEFNTFQCVLFEDGRIEYRYGTISDGSFEQLTGNPGATVGVEDATGSALSVQFGTGTAVVASNSNLAITPTTVPSPCDPCLRADFNGDSDINPDDLGDFITCFFGESTTPGTCAAADFNHDNDINPDDLGDFITLYFQCAG